VLSIIYSIISYGAESLRQNPPNTGVGALDVCARYYALVYTVKQVVAEHGRVDPAHSQTAALEGEYSQTPEEIIALLEAAVQG
jgi:hypothetical protein